MARPYEWSKPWNGRATRWLSLIVAAALAGCGDGRPLPTDSEPRNEPQPAFAPAGVAVSEPIQGAASRVTAANGGASADAASGVVYVSARPGTFPGAATVTVRNLGTGESVSAEVIEGGFDPIAIDGTPGDELEVLVRFANGSSATYRSYVPARKPPRVVRTRPTRDAVDVPLNITVLVVFSEPLDPATVTLDNLDVRLDGAPIAASLTLHEDGLEAELLPEQPLQQSTSYALDVTTGIADLTGDGLEEAVTVTFTTEPGAQNASGGIVIVSGQDQQGHAGRALDEPLVVRVTDGQGNGVPNRQVAWAAEPEGALQGSFDQDGEPVRSIATRTDADGFTQVSLVPTGFDLVRVIAWLAGGGADSVLFTADARDPGATLTIVSGANQNAPAGQLSEPLVVRITDGQGLPAQHVAVDWSIPFGEAALGAFDGADPYGVSYVRARTDADGLAQVSVTPTWFGPVDVMAQLVFTMISGSPATFVVDATDLGAALTIVSGDGQQGKAGEPLTAPLVVRVTDGQGNPVAHVRVEWNVTSAGGLKPVGDAPNDLWWMANRPWWRKTMNIFSDGDGVAQVSFWPWLGIDRVTVEPAGTHARGIFSTSETTVLVIPYDLFLGKPLFAWFTGCYPDCPEDWDVSYITVPVGTTLEWVNHLPALRVASTVVPPGGTAFDSGTLAQNERFRFVPAVPGSWQFIDQNGTARGSLWAY